MLLSFLKKSLFFNTCDYCYPGHAHRKQRKTFIQDVFKIADKPQIEQTKKTIASIEWINKFMVPYKHQQFIEIIRQDLKLRQLHINNPNAAINLDKYKKGILLEGASGLGKSTLLRVLLEEQEFAKESQDSKKHYYEITGGGKKTYQLLIKAFHEGAIVVLDELNLDQNLEKLLNQLLDGFDNQDKPAENPGSMVLASQNPPSFAGRQTSSSALINRLHLLYFDNYSTSELDQIAETKLNKGGAGFFVGDFIQAKKENSIINYRKFFENLEKQPEPKSGLYQFT